MTYEEHVHKWQYNEARQVRWNNLLKWLVIRFCKECHIIEDIELKEKDNEQI